jgi:hypothetical protein
MAQTKRKRRSKHRGNAVGVVEARGRTSKPAPGTKKSSSRGGARGARELKPPSLQGSFMKAAIGAVILFIFFRFLSKGTSTGGALLMCVVALALYTPVMYLTDKWIYNRKMRAQGGAAATLKPRR